MKAKTTRFLISIVFLSQIFGCTKSYKEQQEEKIKELQAGEVPQMSDEEPPDDCYIPDQPQKQYIMCVPSKIRNDDVNVTYKFPPPSECGNKLQPRIYKKILCKKPDFVNNGDGTITDRTNNLMWTVGATPDERSLDGANFACRDVKNAGGYSDWRVPTLEELWTLWTNETQCHFPSIFQGKCWRYWTSTPAPKGWLGSYYAIYFESSYPRDEAVRFQGNWMPSSVRCVRSVGQKATDEKQVRNQAIVKFFDKVKINAEAIATRNLFWSPCNIDQSGINRIFGGENLRRANECFNSLVGQCICPPKSAELIISHGSVSNVVNAYSDYSSLDLTGCLNAIGNEILRSMDLCSVRWRFNLVSDVNEYDEYCGVCLADGSTRVVPEASNIAGDSRAEFSNKLAIAMAGQGSEFVGGGGTASYGRMNSGLGKKRERIVGKIALGSGSTTGYCDKSNIEQVVRRRAGAIRACYEEQLQNQPNLSGKITVRWTINLDGAVKDVQIVQSSLGNEQVENCFLRSVRMMRFAKPVGGTCVVQWPFVFSREGDSPVLNTSTNSEKVSLSELLLANRIENDTECNLDKRYKDTENFIDCTAAQRVFVNVFNIDDTGEIFLDGQRILQVSYGENSGYVDVTSHIKTGINLLRFVVKNQFGGYTWGLEIKCDNTLRYRSVAGRSGELGARNNDQTRIQQTIFDCTVPLVLKKD